MQNFQQSLREKRRLLQYLCPFLREINSSSIVETLQYYFKSQNYLKNSVLTSEGESGEDIFVLVEGRCVVKKKLGSLRNPYLEQSEPIQIHILEPPAFVGEEILIERKPGANCRNAALTPQQPRTALMNSSNQP